MAYPEAPNFRTAGRNAWWEVIYPDGSRRRCQIPGSLFIRAVQRKIQLLVPANSPTYQGTISGSAITLDGKIGPNTMKGLYALLQRMNAPARMLQDVMEEATAGRAGVTSVNAATVRAMIWAASTPTPSEVVLPPGTVLPLWNTAPENDNTELSCALVSAPPGADTTPSPPGETPSLPPGETWTPPKTGETWGKDLASDGSKPIEKILEDLDKPGTPGSKDPVTLSLERGFTADLPTTPIETGLSTGTMVAIGVGVVAVIALVAVVAMRSGGSSGTRRRRRNPSKRRAR